MEKKGVSVKFSYSLIPVEHSHITHTHAFSFSNTHMNKMTRNANR